MRSSAQLLSLCTASPPLNLVYLSAAPLRGSLFSCRSRSSAPAALTPLPPTGRHSLWGQQTAPTAPSHLTFLHQGRCVQGSLVSGCSRTAQTCARRSQGTARDTPQGRSHTREPGGRDQLAVLTQHGAQSPSVPGCRGEPPRPLLEQSWPTTPLLPLPLVPVLPKF